MKQLLLLLSCFLLTACTSGADRAAPGDELPPIYPDYAGVTIPCNIAPLNFMLRNNPDRVEVRVSGASGDMLVKTGGHKVRFPLAGWRALLEAEKGRTLTVTVTARVGGRWIRYAPFIWEVAGDKIDPFLSYRLIEPGYEVWNDIQLVERCAESFDERVIADNNLAGGACMNCHIYGNQDPALSFFHIRGGQGGMILNRGGRLEKLNVSSEGMISPLVYGGFHPTGRYGVFSTNIIVPVFHTGQGEQMEVYDSASELVVVDFDRDNLIIPFPGDNAPVAAKPLRTFPVFSAAGDAVYYCEATEPPALPGSIRHLRYSLHRIAFDTPGGSFGRVVDTLFDASAERLSVCHPKASPDGRYLMYTVSDYGAFPVWHREADLQMIDLRSGRIVELPIVNAGGADSYHSWSSDSRWFVFSSRRDDGLYTRPYFSYIDSAGIASKPFALPQRDPSLYDYTLKSFNIPELSKGPLPFSATDIVSLLNRGNHTRPARTGR